MTGADRLPPYDSEAEEAVLGSLLLDDEAVYRVAPVLRQEDFFRERSRLTYSACLALYERGEAINQITVAHQLAVQGKLEEVGGAGYLSYLVTSVPTSLHIDYYAQIVRRTAMLRNLVHAAGRIESLAYQGDADVEATLAEAEAILYGVRRGEATQLEPLRDILARFWEEIATPTAARGDRPVHIFTEFRDLDRLLGGLKRADLIILAARPSFGKTSFALNIAFNAALHQNATVAIFSLEMSKEQLAQRLLSSHAEGDSQRMRLEHLNSEERGRLAEGVGLLSQAPIYVDDTGAIRVAEMRARLRRLHQEHPLDLVVVDYIQLMSGSTGYQNRVQEMTEISRSLKVLAREMNVPLIAVSQLSRAVQHRSPPTPLLSDLRDSGSIEQDADLVVFLHREDRTPTDPDAPAGDPGSRTRDSGPAAKGIVQVMVSKNRNGPIGTVSLRFVEQYTRFFSLETFRTSP